MDILNVNSKRELELKDRVNDLGTSMEDREKQVTELLITDEYEKIYNEYNSYYKVTKDIEALKRIIFIQWFAVAEPMAFTGIGNLDVNIQKQNFITLSELIKTRAIDDEFEGMISHYYMISDFYFNLYIDFSPFILIINENHIKKPLKLPYKDRGIMGAYWNRLGLKEV